MYNDIVWRERGNREHCIANSVNVAELGSEKKGSGTPVNKPDGEWDKTAEDTMLNFAESGHPAFRATCALEREEF